MIELRLPNVTGTTPEEQIAELKRYLYSTVNQLNWALQTLEEGTDSNTKITKQIVEKQKSPDKAQDNFNEIKGLIIKSAEIVEAFSEEASKRFSSEYVAKSEIGTYVANETADIRANAEGLRVDIDKTEAIAAEIQNIQKEMKGYVKIGDIGNGEIGVEIMNGEEEGEKRRVFARYTAKGTVLTNESGQDAVVIAASKTKLTGGVTIEGNNSFLTIGKYSLDPKNGLGLYWEGEADG